MKNPKEKQTLSRREALKALAAAIAIPHFSEQWETPVVEIGRLPALAQTSPQPTPPTLGTGNLQVTLTWDTGNPQASKGCFEGGEDEGAVDIDLHMIEPNGFRVYFREDDGPTAKLDADEKKAFGPENIFVPAGQSEEGTYQIQVVYYCGLASPTIATIRVKTFADTDQEQTEIFTRVLEKQAQGTAIQVAQVTFPGGVIEEIGGTVPLPPEAQSASKGK